LGSLELELAVENVEVVGLGLLKEVLALHHKEGPAEGFPEIVGHVFAIVGVAMERQGTKKVLRGLFVAPNVDAADPKVVPRPHKGRFQVECLVVGINGLLATTAIGQGSAQPVPQDVVIWSALEGSCEAVHSLVIVAGDIKEHSQANLDVRIN